MDDLAPTHCELCQRQGVMLTRHHLIPRTRHRNRRTRRDVERTALHQRILWVCRPCHDQIHRLFTEKELAEHYASAEALLAEPAIQRFVAWIAGKPPGLKPAGSSWKARRQRRF